MKHLFLGVCAMATLAALPAAAAEQGFTCSFTSECIETETCEATSYDVTVNHKEFEHPHDGMDASARWTDDAASHTVFLRSRPDVVFAMWAENDGRQFGRLMTDGKGDARLVVMDASIPMMISYYGTCKEAE
ncbi:hypothetical protein [Sulfitobacter donghicola]|uniref:Uncharacterized protein n=1 Tax=Sulfitobacter donghicola DSW-25 = KCTC 12864 = JCM 14565 TaxID=1300350 RepID=A0A073IGD0_9RHOB|nr:hypothetical protein [Sulfitobacter donghicola]KEJ88590.1 hypothetical protein DSW25_15685 [Sulfitobacter donghicola DSW-25 = KCTC 12864 = JCM 14565]KIN69593.1 hypothetical protein Z948_3340 [Sulfitobacter donghicola DSW-25 = KCTC 12864 = JCM 14565]